MGQFPTVPNLQNHLGVKGERRMLLGRSGAGVFTYPKRSANARKRVIAIATRRDRSVRSPILTPKIRVFVVRGWRKEPFRFNLPTAESLSVLPISHGAYSGLFLLSREFTSGVLLYHNAEFHFTRMRLASAGPRRFNDVGLHMYATPA